MQNCWSFVTPDFLWLCMSEEKENILKYSYVAGFFLYIYIYIFCVCIYIQVCIMHVSECLLLWYVGCVSVVSVEGCVMAVIMTGPN